MTVYSTPGLYPLEIWRGIADGVPLSQFGERKSEYFLELRRFLLRLHDGSATAGDNREAENWSHAAGFQQLVLCGGEALDPSLEAILHPEALPFAVEIDANGPYAARRGADRIFKTMGWQRGVALDLGQTQLKVMTTTSSAILPRNTSQLRPGAGANTGSMSRAQLRDLLAEGIRRVVENNGGNDGPPDGVILALPVALGSNGVAQSATCLVLCGPVQSIFSGLFACPCVVLNDAVLAGLGFPPESGEKTLIVTLGFGLGCALWMKG